MRNLRHRYPIRTFLLLLFLVLTGVVHAAYGTPWVEKSIIPLNRAICLPILSFFPSLLSFSCFEGLVAMGILGGFTFFVMLLIDGVKASKRVEFFYRRLLILFCILVGGYLLFCVTWGAYYYRSPLADRLGLDIKPVSTQQLYDAGVLLVDKLNQAAVAAPRGADGLFVLPEGKKGVLDRAPQVMDKSGYAFLMGRFPPPKGMLASELLNYLFIDGIYSSFTGEANLNMAGHDLFFPSVTLHEMAHQRGFAREDEANFLAYLVGKDSQDPVFVYAGYMLAYTHLSRALLSADQKKFKELSCLVNLKVFEDFQDYNAFLSSYITPVRDVADATNDVYLKSQGQAEGTKSYGRMVDLLVAQILTYS
jgi:hypothetical protein